jgi:type IV secretory pathway VirB10-like protein
MLASANSMWDSDLRDLRNPALVALPLPLEGMLYDSGSSMKHLAVFLAGFALSTATLHAQASSTSVPESHRPPPGMCRIWIDGVPPTHQPAPTDCATAIRKRPMNARVVFGSDARGNERGFAPAPPKQSSFSSPSVPSSEQQDRLAQQQRDEQERQRVAQQQRDAQERQRADEQRRRDEQEKRAASHAPPPQPQTPRSQERVTPQPRPRQEKSQRPPQSSSSQRRPR